MFPLCALVRLSLRVLRFYVLRNFLSVESDPPHLPGGSAIYCGVVRRPPVLLSPRMYLLMWLPFRNQDELFGLVVAGTG